MPNRSKGREDSHEAGVICVVGVSPGVPFAIDCAKSENGIFRALGEVLRSYSVFSYPLTCGRNTLRTPASQAKVRIEREAPGSGGTKLYFGVGLCCPLIKPLYPDPISDPMKWS